LKGFGKKVGGISKLVGGIQERGRDGNGFQELFLFGRPRRKFKILGEGGKKRNRLFRRENPPFCTGKKVGR